VADFTHRAQVVIDGAGWEAKNNRHSSLVDTTDILLSLLKNADAPVVRLNGVVVSHSSVLEKAKKFAGGSYIPDDVPWSTLAQCTLDVARRIARERGSAQADIEDILEGLSEVGGDAVRILQELTPLEQNTGKEVRVHIRWMIRRDMPEVLAIEAECFEFPWPEEDFIRCLRQRNCIGMVAEHDDRVVGFMVYELNKTWIHVLNFAVAANERRRGVGTQMVAKLIGKLSVQWRSRIALEVRETNLPAQIFFRTVGFRAVSVLRDYYEDTPEDAYLMQYCRKLEKKDGLSSSQNDRLAG
jgi:ribosomal-protein-alanine N-acetyltransferase